MENLVAPVILGVDFLHGNGLVLDFTQGHVVVHRANPSLTVAQILPSTKPSVNRRLEHVQSQHLSNQEQMWWMSVQSQGMMLPQAWNCLNV